MITADEFHRLRKAMGQQAEDDIAWAEGCTAPATAKTYALEAIFVICNSGMHHVVARQIYERVVEALRTRQPVISVFKHVGKAAAIELIWAGREASWRKYLETPDDQKLEYLAGLPWIGDITKYHLAKNFGLPYAKPDVHLQRLAKNERCTPQDLCERLSRETGLGVNAVDTVLWRACAWGLIDRVTGEVCCG